MSFASHKVRSAWLYMMLIAGLLCSCGPRHVQNIPVKTVTPGSPEPAYEQSQIKTRISLPRKVRVAFGDNSIWVSNPAERSVSRIDMVSGEIVGSPMILGFEPREIAYGEGAVWVCSADRSRLARIEPQTGQVAAEVDLRALQIPDDAFLLIAAGEGAVWLTDQTRVIQIDPQTHQLVGEPLPAGEEIITLALGHGTLWTGSHDDGIVTRVDARAHRVIASIDMGFSVHGLAVSEEAAWVLDEHGFGVVRIDPQSHQPGERVSIDFVGSNLSAGAGSVWVAPAAQDSGRSTNNDGVVRIDEQAKRIAETIHVGGAGTSEYYSVYFSEGSLWVLIDGTETSLVQIVPSRLTSP